MSNIRALNSNLSPETVLKLAREVEFEEILIVGWQDGELFISGSSNGKPENNWLLDCAKQWFLDN